MIYQNAVLLLLLLLIAGCHAKKGPGRYESENLMIKPVSGHAYRHISYLDAGRFGMYPCNGMIVFDSGEAVIFDTPTNDEASRELIRWVKNDLGCKIKAVIPTHFHDDCLAGLNVFHENGIPSYAHTTTVSLARDRNEPIPQNGFDSSFELEVGNQKVYATYFGEGHTKDNIVGYLPVDEVMFGGCLIKEMGAGKGNLQDANVQDWPMTVSKIKENYGEINKVIPGHGEPGGMELFEFTIELFTEGE